MAVRPPSGTVCGSFSRHAAWPCKNPPRDRPSVRLEARQSALAGHRAIELTEHLFSETPLTHFDTAD